MSERCIVRIKFTPAGTASEVRRAVGGFLRYVQHRDLHPDSGNERPAPEVAGLLKYVAYRDRASSRAELFGPAGAIGTSDRRAFAEFVAKSLTDSAPAQFRTREGRLMDQRRAVSRLILSPERAQGLDLEELTRAATAGLESEFDGLRWIAAIHRNTRHHHVHLVIAGMHATDAGGFRRVDINKVRLAAMKEGVALEIQRQREAVRMWQPQPVGVSKVPPQPQPAGRPGSVETGARFRAKRLAPSARRRERTHGRFGTSRVQTPDVGSLVALRAVARRYSLQMARETEDEARGLAWERAA
jgi:hypothetical protein